METQILEAITFRNKGYKCTNSYPCLIVDSVIFFFLVLFSESLLHPLAQYSLATNGSDFQAQMLSFHISESQIKHCQTLLKLGNTFVLFPKKKKEKGK